MGRRTGRKLLLREETRARPDNRRRAAALLWRPAGAGALIPGGLGAGHPPSWTCRASVSSHLMTYRLVQLLTWDEVIWILAI